MSASEIGNLVLTIVLGFVSIGLGIFAVWLSIRFNEQSSAALNAVKDLANEIRTLTQATLSQQTDFSSKMLDSILSKDQFGKEEVSDIPSTALENVFKRQLDDTEARISTAVEQKIRALLTSNGDPSTIQKALEAIRSDIRGLTTKASSLSSNIEPPTELREHIDDWVTYPGYLVLMAAIIKENAHSLKELEGHEQKYRLPNGWERALRQLISKNILHGSDESFNIKAEYQTPIAALIDRNWSTIRKVIKYFEIPENRDEWKEDEIKALMKGFET